MFSTSRRKWLWTTIASTLIALGAQWAHAQSNQPPVKVGMLLGFTGPAAQGAANYLAATKLAVKEINDAGGLLGRRIELVQADHGLDPARAVSEARRLVQLEKVTVVLGPEASGLAVAVAPIFNEAKILYFSTTVTAAPTPFNFTSLMSGLTQATAMMEFAANNLKAKTVAIIADNGSVGKVLQEDVKRRAPGTGLQLAMTQ